MSRFTIRELCDATGAELLRGRPDAPIAGVSTDTRTIAPGELFLALSGPNFDGNEFARAAAERGAAALLLRAEPRLEAPAGAAAVLAHEDPRRALADLASWHRSRLDAPVVGITGSCGKTTTKDLVAALLGERARVVASPRSYNNDVGVPLTLLAADETTEVLVCEIGTNRPGEIAALCRVARPTVGVITNVGAAHLEGLGSLSGVAREKGDLAAAIPRSGVLCLNADCRYTPTFSSNSSARVVTFGMDGAGDLSASDVWFHDGSTSFRLTAPGIDGCELALPLLGTHNVQNCLAALAVAHALGHEIGSLLPAIGRLRAGRQRMERIEAGGIVVFDDTYNSNPDSAEAAVRVLAGSHGHARRVVVLGDMLELGEFAAEMHHRVGAAAARAGIDLFVPVGELAKAAAAGALEHGLDPASVVHFPTVDEAVARLSELVARGDAVLVKGSRLMRMERIVERLRSVEPVESRAGVR